MMNPSMKRALELLLDWQSVSSLFAMLMLLNTLANHIPLEIRIFAKNFLARIFTYLKPTTTIIIEDTAALAGVNHLYVSAQLYLGAHCLSESRIVRLFKPSNAASPLSSLPDSHTVHDTFRGFPMKWISQKHEQSESRSDPFRNRGIDDGTVRRSLRLEFHQKHRNLVHDFYIPYVIEEAARLQSKSRERKLYTNRSSNWVDDGLPCWTSRTFFHPSNFDTLALDPTLREEIRDDLLRFVSRKDHYMRVGRAWKRGYLLYGPPGTGKTSLVAAIANLLEYDLYDLELTAVHTNSQLRRLLVSTTPKSVIVIEDIDCTIDLSDRKKKQMEEDQGKPQEDLNLSGVLNFIDGLWSSCVGERLMIFTTNHPDKLDPALLRPGRMDKKIELGYCRAAAFRLLVKNYLCLSHEVEIEKIDIVAEIERMLGEVEVTPAEVAEVFLGCDGASADETLDKLLGELRQRKLSPPSEHVAVAVAVAVSTDKDSLEVKQ